MPPSSFIGGFLSLDARRFAFCWEAECAQALLAALDLAALVSRWQWVELEAASKEAIRSLHIFVFPLILHHFGPPFLYNYFLLSFHRFLWVQIGS